MSVGTDIEFSSDLPRVIVINWGALRGYAIPVALERSQMLEAFFTDLCGSKGLGRWARYGTSFPALGPVFQRLSQRQLPVEIIDKTKTFDAASIAGEICAYLARTPAQLTKARKLKSWLASQSMRSLGFGQATHVYSVFGQGLDYLGEAKARGLRVICDVNNALSAEDIVRQEQRRFSDWELPLFGAADPEFRTTILRYSDLMLCPSEFVRQDLVNNFGVATDRTCVVPYVVPDRWLSLTTEPVKGRILFVGAVGLRKGAHYLALCENLLYARGRHYEFWLAGEVSPMFRNRPECKRLQFLGRVPRMEIVSQFAQADVLVLPSLAEGSAGVTYEALGAGLPVVTTEESGSVVRNGIDGLIVPSRNPDALASAIRTIVEDRPLRERMASAARERAKEFTVDRYKERLVDAILCV